MAAGRPKRFRAIDVSCIDPRSCLVNVLDAAPLAGDVLRDVGDVVPSPLVCSLSLSSPSGCELAETSVIMDNTSHKAAREAVDLEVVDVDLADLVIECVHGLGRPRAS